MEAKDATVGTFVRMLVDFCGVPKGTRGVVDEDYGTGVMVAWDLPDRALPLGYRAWDGRAACCAGTPLRDGFDKERDLRYLSLTLEELLRRVLPLLIRLGDFIGNGETAPPIGIEPYDRCALILQIRDAIEDPRQAADNKLAEVIFGAALKDKKEPAHPPTSPGGWPGGVNPFAR